MTFKEKLMQEHPDCVSDGYSGGCLGHPHTYGYEIYSIDYCRSHSCVECWNRETPEPQGNDVSKPETTEPDNDKVAVHATICSDLTALYERKNHDYGDSFGKGFAEYGMTMPCIRLEDKLNRLKSLLKSDAQVMDESIDDTLMDLANYAIMTLIERRRT